MAKSNSKDTLNDDKYLIVSGACEHNLRDVSVRIPKNRLVVFTGVSGSGKSSLAFDTIFAEGQRRYVESLSAYARQFLGQMEKPKYESIRGLSPAISIDQKSTSKNPRSTVGTITEIYDYLRVLFARIGIQTCHLCGKIVGRGDPESMVTQIINDHTGEKIVLLAPLVDNRKGKFRELFQDLKAKGFTRVRVNGVLSRLEEVQGLEKHKKHTIAVVVDRLAVKQSQDFRKRLTDSVETALKAGEGSMIVHVDNGKDIRMSENKSCCGFAFPKLDPPSFSFNSPQGMCESCNGIGTVLSMDETKVVDQPDLSISEGAVAPWRNYFEDGKLRDDSWNYRKIEALQKQWGVDLHKPWKKLPKTQQNLVLNGSKNKRLKIKWESARSKGEFDSKFNGLLPTLMRRYKQTKSEGMRAYYAKYMSTRPCEACEGMRLKPEILAVKVGKKSIADLTSLTIKDAEHFLSKLDLSKSETFIAKELLREILGRLGFLNNVGLSYLTLDRKGPTLSGGEAQRIRLASQIGSELTGVLYILDEPSIGLHQRDNRRLLDTLKHLRDIGNSVLVVEHDYDTINESDWVIDFGPGAGSFGGQIVAEDKPQKLGKYKQSLTGAYLSGTKHIAIPEKIRKPPEFPENWIQIIGASENNLNSLNVNIPLGLFVAVTGVSGAGKSTLVNQILYPFLAKRLNNSDVEIGQYKKILGYESIDKVVNIDQKPIGRTPRSNPATYTKLFDSIRDLFASLPESRMRGYKKGRFSFNVKGGRCENCSGDGYRTVEMHFLPDVFVPCEICRGKRFNQQTLEVKYRGYSIAEILEMSVQDAQQLFRNLPKIERILSTLMEVGLSYIALGQAATTLSGGEAQRIKLARELAKRDTGNTFYILDEPTTGLHFDDVDKLLNVLHKLVDAGNTVLVIEHNLDVIKTADWIIDIGPEGGEDGGRLVAEGPPGTLIKVKNSYTGQYLGQTLH